MDRQDALNQLTKAVAECRAAGLRLSVTPMFGESTIKVALFLQDEDVRYGSGRFFISDGQIWSRQEGVLGIQG